LPQARKQDISVKTNYLAAGAETGYLGKIKISWRNKKEHRGEIKTIVAVQKIFTPILKTKNSSTNRKNRA
jgi:hypothetical protein